MRLTAAASVLISQPVSDLVAVGAGYVRSAPTYHWACAAIVGGDWGGVTATHRHPPTSRGSYLVKVIRPTLQRLTHSIAHLRSVVDTSHASLVTGHMIK